MKETQETNNGIEMSRKSVPDPKIDPQGKVLGALVEFLNSDTTLLKTFEQAIIENEREEEQIQVSK